MIFTPHRLQKKQVIPVENDEFGRPIPFTGGEKWVDVCACRCDDNTTKEFKSEDGQVYRPNYHVVCEGKPNLTEGDYVRCLSGTSIRGEGQIYVAKSANYYNYSEIWM